MTKFISTTNCYLLKEGCILLLQRSADKDVFPNFWMGPGGKQEAAESVLETCERELTEETGLSGTNFQLRVVATHYYPSKDIVYLVFIFVADYAHGEIKESREGHLEWLTVETALSLDKLYPDLRINLPEALKKDTEVSFTHLTFADDGQIET